MGLLDKVKNMFIEEVEDDEIKKEVIQVKIPTPEKKEEQKEHEYEPNPKYDEDYERPTLNLEELKKEKEEENKKKEEVEITNIKPALPKFFDDDDFVQEEKPKPSRSFDDEIRTYSKVNTYGTKKETKKVFTPTPIISPVYGVLDKNYKKEEISSKKKNTPRIYSQFDKMDVDDIRRKAYGTLEEELESNLSRDAIVFNDDIDVDMSNDKEITDYEEQPLDIFKELDKKDALDDLLNSYEVENEEVETKNTEDLVEEELNRDYLDALSTSEDDNLIEEQLSRDYDELEEQEEEQEENDLFDLIDNMYSKEENE